jgi:hypothetical protein
MKIVDKIERYLLYNNTLIYICKAEVWQKSAGNRTKPYQNLVGAYLRYPQIQLSNRGRLVNLD